VDIRVECVTPDGLSGMKRVWFRGIFHLIGILGESPFVSKLRKAESAQHSVHPTGGSLAAKKEYTTLKLIPSKRRCLVPPASGWITYIAQLMFVIWPLVASVSMIVKRDDVSRPVHQG
jgi:hypothetical protein